MLIGAYGSLKEGFYNHGALGLTAKLVGKSSVKGVMHLRGSYPVLVHGKGDDALEHELEIYNISESAFNRIHHMELMAGYVEEELKTPFGVVTMWWMPKEGLTDYDKWIPAYTKEVLGHQQAIS